MSWPASGRGQVDRQSSGKDTFSTRWWKPSLPHLITFVLTKKQSPQIYDLLSFLFQSVGVKKCSGVFLLISTSQEKLLLDTLEFLKYSKYLPT